MSYNISISSVTRWERTLQEFLTGNDVTVKPAGNTSVHMTAYMIREALLSARMLKIEPYHKLDYSISPRPKEGLVICRSRSTALPEIVSSIDPGSVFNEVIDEYDVVEILSTRQEPKYLFPSFSGEVESVRNFAEPHGYIVISDNPLTIERK